MAEETPVVFGMFLFLFVPRRSRQRQRCVKLVDEKNAHAQSFNQRQKRAWTISQSRQRA